MPITETTLNFLTENRQNSSRVWFHENRPAYINDVLEPMIELVKALTPAMPSIDPFLKQAQNLAKLYLAYTGISVFPETNHFIAM